jgi:hypothetical protein
MADVSLSQPDDDAVSVADLERIVAVCDRFDKAWRGGQPRHIEDDIQELPEPLLIQGYEGLKVRAAKLPPAPGKSNLAEAAERIVPFYEAWGKPDKAAELRKRLEGDKKEHEPRPGLKKGS